MYNVSEEYLEKINSSSRDIFWYGKITLTNGTEIDFDISNLKAGQTTITKQLCDSNTLRIGSACSSELKIAFMLDYDYDTDIYSLNGIEVDKFDFYDALIEFTFRLQLDPLFGAERYEEIPMGKFLVAEPDRSRMVLTCTAYDFMQKFSKPCVSTIQGTPYNALLSACSVCGVELGNTAREIMLMPNGDRSIAEYDPKNEIKTWRDAISYIAGMLCGNAVIKSDNKLYIIPYGMTSVRDVPADNRVSLTLADYLTTYNAVTATNLRNNTEEKVSTSGNGLTYALGSNPMIQYTVAATRTAALTELLDALKVLEYVPFNGTFFCDPSFELGDVVNFTENHARESTISVITKMTIHLSSHMEMTCEGDDPYKQIAEEAAADPSDSATGSVGDGVTFYDYMSTSTVVIEDGEEEQIALISYSSNGDYRQEFTGEIKIGVVCNETLTSEEEVGEGEEITDGTYEIEDCDVLVTYYLNGQEITSYHPEETFTDGVHLLHLYYEWTSDVRIDTSTFAATITANGGDVTILAGNSRSRIMQSGTAYVAPSNMLLYIEATKMPNKEVYSLHENLDYTGLVISAFYEDGHSENVTSQCTFTPADGTEVTDTKYIMVNVEYVKDGKIYKTSFGLDTHYLIAISVKKEPTKSEYYVGENIDLSGVKIVATYNDTKKDVDVTSRCSFSPADGTTITQSGSVKVTATFTDGGITKTCDIILTALAIICEGIEVTTLPTKVSYRSGETLDYTGVVVTASYNNGITRNVTNDCTFNPSQWTVVDSTTQSVVTVTYTEDGRNYVDAFNITLLVIEEIKIVTPPTKTTYWEGEWLNISGIQVLAYWSDGTTEDVTEYCMYTPNNGDKLYLQSTLLTAAYSEHTDTCDLTIEQPADPELKYLEYYVNNLSYGTPYIVVYGLDIDSIKADGLTNITIPSSYTGSDGYTYQVRMSSY